MYNWNVPQGICYPQFSSYVDRTYHDAVPGDLPVCFLWKKMISLFRETKFTVTPEKKNYFYKAQLHKRSESWQQKFNAVY